MGPRKTRWCWVAQPWRPAPIVEPESTALAARPPVRENLRRRTAILEKSAFGASECSPGVLERSLAYAIVHRTQSNADLFIASCISKLVDDSRVPECARQVVGGCIIAVERAGEADGRVLAKKVIHPHSDPQAAQRQGVFPLELDVVVDDRLQDVEILRRFATGDACHGCIAASFRDGMDIAHNPARLPVTDAPADLRIQANSRNRAVVDFNSDLPL